MAVNTQCRFPRVQRLKPLVTTLFVALLAACSEGAVETADLTPPATAQTSDAVDSVVVQEAARSTVIVGSTGGSLRLSDRIGAVYSIAYRDGAAWLEGVALLRGEKRGWYNNDVDKAPTKIQNIGIGGSLGRHMVVITPKADGVWVDDRLYVPLNTNNVALFDGAGDEPVQVGLTALEAYLGPAPLDDAQKRKTLVQERLRAILNNSRTIRDLWSAE